MFKNSFQLTLRVYHEIPFLFLLTRVKLTSNFRSSFDQLDPVSPNSALWTNWIFALFFFFSLEVDFTFFLKTCTLISLISHATKTRKGERGTDNRKRASGRKGTAVIRIKKWRITTRKKSLSTSFKRALFELSVVWLESLINCSNVLKPSIDSQTPTRFLSLLQFMVQGFPTQFLIGRSSQKILK